MKILVLGGDGMLGHQLVKSLSEQHEVKFTLRQDPSVYGDMQFISNYLDRAFTGVDVRDPNRLIEVLSQFQPDVILNCIGIVKQRKSSNDKMLSLEINSLLPHRLTQLCKIIGSKLIHISTDCVFSGDQGNYSDFQNSDAKDVYGKTKYMGEIQDSVNCLTLRTSIIGFELVRKGGLLEWFLSEKGAVKGYSNAIFSGFTTLELSRIIENLIVNHKESYGLYNVSSQSISKYNLLNIFNSVFEKDLEVNEDNSFRCNRSLDSSRFRSEFDYSPPNWESMIKELAYDKKR